MMKPLNNFTYDFQLVSNQHSPHKQLGNLSLTEPNSTDTNFIDSFTAEAWSLDQSKPIIIELQIGSQIRPLVSSRAPNHRLPGLLTFLLVLLGVQYHECALPPKIRLFQSAGTLSSKKLLDEVPNFGVLSWFLTNRLEQAMQKNWRMNYKDSAPIRSHGTKLNKSGKLKSSQNIDKHEVC